MTAQRSALPAVLVALAARAEAPDIRAAVDRDSVSEDGLVTLQITIEAPGGYDRYDPPAMDDFTVFPAGRRTSTQVTMNGADLQVRSSEVHTYRLRPRHAGMLRIGAARLHAQGATYETRPIAISALPGTAQPAPPPSLAPIPPSPLPWSSPFDEPAIGEEDLFLQAVADRREAWVGEQVTVTWLVFTRSDIRQFQPTRDPRTPDFWSEDLYQPSGHLAYERQQVGGREYLVAPVLRKALFPLREGVLVVEPMEAQIRTMAGIFASEAFVRTTPELRIVAKPLPQDGRPTGFDAAHVGRFEISADVDRAEVAVGEPIVLRVAIRGAGNVRALRPPAVAADGFKVYDPRATVRIDAPDPGSPRVGGEQRLEYALVPTREGALTIPPVPFAYFDPETGGYRATATQPITITVRGGAPASAEDAGERGVNEVAQDIRPIRRRADLGFAGARPIYREPLFFALLGVGPASWLGVLAVGAVRARARKDTPRSRLRRACGAARIRLRRAERSARGSSADDAAPTFFGEVAAALRDPLSEGLGRRVEGMTREELAEALAGRGASSLARAVIAELDNCDFARYAHVPPRGLMRPATTRQGEMSGALARARDLVRRIEKME
ncbi:MAG: BatD family protein [Myxococcota bacterium]